MKIKLNSTTSIDLATLIESRLLVQANSGGGKSWAIRRIVEQVFGHVQIIILDPEGEFANLRSRYDFVYAGKGGDTSAEPRSAALLAKKLLELKASAIIDLYELPPQERKHFVRLFIDSMVNAPKELWHDCLVILDEAHIFAPEKSESEALGAVIDLATRGRKRGYCVVLASQRISKLHKDAAAECNNKLIGRTTLDIDRKRAGEELGLTSKEEVLALRNLVPGEFMVFGTAISPEVKRIHIGDVIVKPLRRGLSKSKPPAPSSAVKAILAKLADLPQEAAKEAQTIQELHRELRAARAEITRLGREKKIDPEIEKSVVMKAVNWEKQSFRAFKNKIYQELLKTHGNIGKLLELVNRTETRGTPLPVHNRVIKRTPIEARARPIETQASLPREGVETMGAGELKVLRALGQFHPDGITREHITILTGYKRSTRDAYIQRLMQKGYVMTGNDAVQITEEGMSAAGRIDPLPEGRELAEHYIRTLPEGEAKVLQFLFEQEMAVSREQISDATGYKRSTRDAYIHRLRVRQLVNLRGQLIKISDHLV